MSRLKRLMFVLSLFLLSPAAQAGEHHPQDTMLMPDWMKRIEISGSFLKNDIWFEGETIQSLYQSPGKHHTVFVQGHVAYNRGDDFWTLNGGAGYRYLLEDGSWLLGGSLWFDHQTDHGHERVGASLEAIGQVITLRGNIYEATSGWKTVSNSPTTLVEEKALDGFDVSLDGAVPYLPWLRVGAGYYQWDMPDDLPGAKDVRGVQANAMAQISDRIALEGVYKDDNYDSAFSGRVRIALGALPEAEFTALKDGIANQAFTPRDLSKHTLTKVKRNHKIIVARRVTDKNAPAAQGGGVFISAR